MSEAVACAVCGGRATAVARELGACAACLRSGGDRASELAASAHGRSRRAFALPEAPPRAAQGAQCVLCAHACRIEDGRRGYCGLRTARQGRLVHLGGVPRRGLLEWYRDPLPTNCVADWVCGGSRRYGMHNLAVFYQSCTLDCLFCQNWHFREVSPEQAGGLTAEELGRAANERTYCVCFFGGDPASQMTHALAAGRMLAEAGVVVCWETAGTSHPKLLDQAVELSLATGGCVKFDLKAWSEPLHVALTGGSNRRSLENFARAARRAAERAEPPLVVASTLLVPGYVDAIEVSAIARFIAGIDPEIPYALLAFAPHFRMADLPRTPRRQAFEAEAAARVAGLRNVRLGNRHLLV
jgi:pyruvate formate lyase activating enzyme